MKKILFLILSVYAVQTVNAQWAVDLTFGSNGIAHTIVGSGGSSGHAMVVQSDNKIVIAGETSTYQGAVVRLNADGSLDNSFGDGGKVLVPQIGNRDYLFDVVVQSDGKIVATGYSSRLTGYDIILVRLNVDGTLDETFSNDGIAVFDFDSNVDIAEAISIQSDGKYVLGGYSAYEFTVVRVNTDGTLDPSFGTGGITKTHFGIDNSSSIFDIAIQSDGKIVAVGITVDTVNYNMFAVARYNTDGTADSTFGIDGKKSFHIGAKHDFLTSVCIQGDGKILLGGHTYLTYGPKYDIAVVRLLNDGSMDNTFGINGVGKARIVNGANYVNEMLVQPDGKIVVAGYTVKEIEYEVGVARFESNGSLDDSFTPTGTMHTSALDLEDYGEAVALQSNGAIIVAGRAYNGDVTSEIIALRYAVDMVGIEETKTIGNVLSIFPNPANNVLKIETKSTCNIDILDVSGKVVFSTVSDSQVLVDVSKLSSGFYFVRAISNSTHEVMKLIIE